MARAVKRSSTGVWGTSLGFEVVAVEMQREGAVGRPLESDLVPLVDAQEPLVFRQEPVLQREVEEPGLGRGAADHEEGERDRGEHRPSDAGSS